MLLENKVVIITGIGPGMGRKLALEAGKVGAKLILAARSKDFVESVAREVGDQAVAVIADVSKQADCDRIAAAAIERFGRIDGLVNSAYGSAPFVPFEEADLADWRRAMDVTIFGTLQMVKSVLPHMKQQGGAIVNVSTMETRKTLPGHGGYVISKVGLAGVTRQLAVELVQTAALRAEGDAVELVLGLVPAGPDAELDPAARDVVDRDDVLREHRCAAERHRRDQGAEPDPLGARRACGEQRPGVETPGGLSPDDRAVVVRAEDGVQPRSLRLEHQREPVVPGDPLLALEHQADLHGG